MDNILYKISSIQTNLMYIAPELESLQKDSPIKKSIVSVLLSKALYFFLYIKPKAVNSAWVQKLADNIIKILPSVESSQEVAQLNKLYALCLNKGAQLNLPLLKVSHKRKHSEKEEAWIDNLQQRALFNDVKTYQFILNNEAVANKDKCLLESILLQSLMADLIFINYSKNNKNYFSNYLSQRSNRCSYLGAQYNPLYEVELMIDRGYIFENQISTFLSLSSIFGHREIFDSISNKSKLSCYEAFNKLNIVAKKTLTAILIKNRNDDALINLLRYGVKLDWQIAVDSERKNILAFELLYDNKWIKAVIDHKNMDVRQTNSRGDNILHVMGGSALNDEHIAQALRRKINELNAIEKQFLFFQMNEYGLTPLMKAVIDQDEAMIEFIEEFNIKPWDEVVGASLFPSALYFLENYILNHEGNSEKDNLIEYYKNTFWLGLKKKWDSQYCYTKLQTELIKNQSKRKIAKI